MGKKLKGMSFKHNDLLEQSIKTINEASFNAHVLADAVQQLRDKMNDLLVDRMFKK